MAAGNMTRPLAVLAVTPAAVAAASGAHGAANTAMAIIPGANTTTAAIGAVADLALPFS